MERAGRPGSPWRKLFRELSQAGAAAGLEKGVRNPVGRDFSPTVNLNQSRLVEISNDLDLHRQEYLNDVGVGK